MSYYIYMYNRLLYAVCAIRVTYYRVIYVSSFRRGISTSRTESFVFSRKKLSEIRRSRACRFRFVSKRCVYKRPSVVHQLAETRGIVSRNNAFFYCQNIIRRLAYRRGRNKQENERSKLFLLRIVWSRVIRPLLRARKVDFCFSRVHK